MALCIYGCGKEYTPTRAGAYTAKGHKTCFDSFRRAESAAAAALHPPPPPAPKREQPECIYKCGKPFNPVRKGPATARSHKTCYDAARSKDADSLRNLVEPAGGFATPALAPPKREHPKGWEPHVEESGNTATAISQPTENASPDEDELIRGWKLDPKQWRIVGPLNCRRWQATAPVIDAGKVVGHELKWLFYYKANLERIDPLRESQTTALIEEIRLHVPMPGPYPTGEDAFVVTWADLQAGKSDGDGSKGIVGRALAAIDSVERRVAELRTIGRKLGTLYALGLGDLIENCDGHYPQQTFRTDLDLRDQVNVTRRIVLKSLERWAPLFERVVVAAVGGNHGENRKDGKSFTTFADNHDVAIFDQVHDVLRENPAVYGHVSFSIPKDALSLTLDMAGEIVGVTHGHLFRVGKGHDWWAKQAHGEQPVGDARILITGHYHHFSCLETGSKTWIQCPSLEGGSDWWRNVSGENSRKGVLTMRVGKNVSATGWADLEIV